MGDVDDEEVKRVRFRRVTGLLRVPITDDRPPLTSPITLLVCLLHGAGFRWYGVQKRLPDGTIGTTCFLDTSWLWSDGTTERRIVWSLIGDEPIDLGGDRTGIAQLTVALGFDSFAQPRDPLGRGAREVVDAIRRVESETGFFTDDPIPFNERGKRLVAAAAQCGQIEARRLLAHTVEVYRGFCWKLATPVGHPPHPEYGWPLDRHYRYRKGKRKGDVRASISREERMDELATLRLR